jgi:hypothetical protein
VIQPEDSGSSVCYVLAAWQSSKEFAGVEFGLGSYSTSAYLILDHGACYPAGGGIDMATDGWPGPNTGIALAVTGGPWSGNYVPVYYFAGYAYSQTEVPIAENPPEGIAAFANMDDPPIVYPISPDRLGVLGVGVSGTAPCPQGGGGSIGDLSGGVLVLHHPLGLEYSSDTPPGGWCGEYQQVDGCSGVNPRIGTQ